MTLHRRPKPLPAEPRGHGATPTAASHVARALRAQRRQAVLERESHRQVREYLHEHAASGS